MGRNISSICLRNILQVEVQGESAWEDERKLNRRGSASRKEVRRFLRNAANSLTAKKTWYLVEDRNSVEIDVERA